MKSVASNDKCEKKELPFPKLMVSKETKQVVLFISECKGTRVGCGNLDSGAKLGTYKDCWISRSFEDYTGSVCLNNDVVK